MRGILTILIFFFSAQELRGACWLNLAELVRGFRNHQLTKSHCLTGLCETAPDLSTIGEKFSDLKLINRRDITKHYFKQRTGHSNYVSDAVSMIYEIPDLVNGSHRIEVIIAKDYDFDPETAARKIISMLPFQTMVATQSISISPYLLKEDSTLSAFMYEEDRIPMTAPRGIAFRDGKLSIFLPKYFTVDDFSGDIRRTLLHEHGHNIASYLYRPAFSDALAWYPPFWRRVILKDRIYVTRYSGHKLNEDFAESFEEYFIRKNISETLRMAIPSRTAFFDLLFSSKLNGNFWSSIRNYWSHPIFAYRAMTDFYFELEMPNHRSLDFDLIPLEWKPQPKQDPH